MKSALRWSRASGSTKRRVEDVVLGRGRYSPSAIARRAARRPKGANGR